MKEVIQKAYEGGYRPEKLNSKFEWSEDMRSATEEYQVDWRDCVLDPLFWQALGKAMGWSEEACQHCGEELIEDEHSREPRALCPQKCGYDIPPFKGAYLYHWHRFIDHLASNGNVDEFFTELLK